MDVRLVGYCLSLPPVPWCVRKTILRRAMKGALPASVLDRPKSPLPEWPGARALARPESRWVDDFALEPGLARYVRRSRVPPATRGDPFEAWMNLRPLTLSLWSRDALLNTPRERNLVHEIA
jgi:asparagine synthase (glutamine-hydrolysing)